MSETIAENTDGNTGGVEGRQVHLDLDELARHWNDEVPGQRRDAIVGACWSSNTEHGLVKTEGFVQGGDDGGRGVEEAQDQRLMQRFV